MKLLTAVANNNTNQYRKTEENNVRFEVFMAVTMNNAVF
jgi:hypothetical protein